MDQLPNDATEFNNAALTRLVKRTQAGDKTAFEELYKRYFTSIKKYFGHLVEDDAVADDLAQETFERAWQNLHTLPDVNRAVELKAWLRSIAKDMVLGYMKSRPKLQATFSKEKEPE